MKRLILLATLAVLAWGQSATNIRYPGKDFNTPRMMEPQAVPTSSTTIFTGDFILDGGWISCSTARTVTITDGNSQTIFPTVSIAANSVAGLSIFAGSYFPTSVTIIASGSGCMYHIWGRQ